MNLLTSFGTAFSTGVSINNQRTVIHCNKDQTREASMSKFEIVDEKHKLLLSQAHSLASTADSVGVVSIADLRENVDECLRYLANDLNPFCEVSHAVVYPVVGEIFGSLNSTNTMSHDIVEIRHLTAELERLHHILNKNDEVNVFEANKLRSVLFGVYAIISLHLTKEAEIYLSMLDKRLTEDEVRSLTDRISHAFTALR